MAALPAAQAVPDDDDDDLGGPVLPPLQPILETVSGNPWPAAGSPVSSDQVTALLHQLGNTTALLGQVIGQRSASDSSVSGLTGKDMSRIMPRPEPFRAATREQEHSAWPSWLWSLEQYLTVLDPKFGEEIDQLKSNLHRQVNISPAATDIVARSRQLFALLSVLVKGRGFLVIKSVSGNCGYEALRQLISLYAPQSKSRSLGILTALTQVSAFKSGEAMFPQILELERVFTEYESASQQLLQEELKTALLLRCLPAASRNQVHATLPEDASYAAVRDCVLRIERQQFKWQGVSYFGDVAQGSGAGTGDGATPMEIDRVAGKGKKGKGKTKGKDSKGKGKHGKDNKGKGHHGKDKGQSKGKQGDKPAADKCLYCNKSGHWKRDCRKYKADLKAGKVQAVSEESGSTVSTVTPSQSASQVGAKGRVARLAEIDLTAFDECDEEFLDGDTRVCMIQCSMERVEHFSISDPSEVRCNAWDTICEYELLSLPSDVLLKLCEAKQLECHADHSKSLADPSSAMQIIPDPVQIPSSALQISPDPWQIPSSVTPLKPSVYVHGSVRALASVNGEDIILDSGADISALPETYAQVGEPAPSSAQRFVDASGRLLQSKGIRIAEVRVGSIRFREKFLIGGVTCPLLSLGKLYKAGFYVIPSTSGDSDFILTNGDLSEPVRLKRQSLCATGSVRVLNALPSAVRAVSAALHGPLLRLDASGWQRIGSRRYALLSFGQSYVDSTLIPLTELLWYRTTLVRRDGRWTVAELAADVSSLTDRTLPLGPPAVEQVITIAYDDASLSPESLGFSPSDSDDVPGSQGAGSVEAPEVPVPNAADQGPEVPVPNAADQGPEVPMPDAADQGAGVGGLEGDSDLPPSADQAAPVAPAADGGGEAAPSEREVIDSVTVNGVVIDRNSSLRVMRAALVSLGLGKNGSKSQCWERLVRHLREADLLREHQVHHNLSAELSRPPHAPPVPAAPSDHDRAQHVLTHEPYQPWCDACVKFRGRQDRHPSEASHDPGSRSVLSFDFGYCSREADDGVREAKDRLTVLFLHDRHTKAVHAIPTAQKGGSSLSHLVTESARFAIWLGHRSLRLRCDNEPAILAVQAGLLKALRNLGVDVSKDTAPVESHQSNGPVEQVVGSIRQHAAVLMHDLEQACGAKDDQVLFPPLHPIYGWALAHACWLRNRYTPVHGTTPYEAVTDSAYSGTICRFGEKVLGYLKPDGKSSARWRHGLWLGKAIGNDTHILGLVGGVFVTRSVRRFEDNFDPDFAASFDVSVFEHGLSSIGGKLVLGHKKPAAPVAMPIPAYVGPPPSPPAAAESPLPHEAQGSPSQIAGTDSPVRSPTSINYSPSDGMSATEDAALSDRHGDVLSTDAGEPSSAEAGMPAIPAEAGAAASSAPLISEALGLSENPRPAKVARRSDDDQVMALEGQISLITAPGCCADEVPAGDLLVTSGEESPCVVHIRQVCYEHEDENVTLTFDGDTLDELEDYDQSFLEDQSGDTELLPELCRPRTSDIEPELSPEELEALDVIADGVEIARLEGMTVLLPESAAHNDEYAGQEATHLTTRMVRTWREKELGGSPVWYRRSRYVAREYAWLNERHDLFSPASTALSNRLLPIHYLCHEPDPDDPWVMVALDISDAYLSVKQTRLVIVQHAGVRYVLGRVLPGQRDGSKEWYLAFSSFLDEALGFKKCDALPSLIREPAFKFSMQMHVDDLLGAGSKRFLLERLRPTLESKYCVSIRILEASGDTISFLKRHHTLLADGKMLLTPSAKHFEKLFSVMKIDERSAPKKTPYAPQLDEIDNSELLTCADAKAFRCAIGILLYLAVDLIECQGAIRALSSYMTSPTRNAQAALRHLLKYLLEGQHHGLLLDRRNCYNGVSGEIPRPSQPILCLEAFSDANWAAHRGSRKSVSSGMVFVAGCLLYSSSRTQRVIALSSGESELLAATSTLCDALFVRQLLAFIADDEPPQIHHFLDASAAKGIMERSGVGRVRHLSVRVLWTQQLVADKIIMLRKVATSINVADLNTKGLSRSRMLMLLHIIGCWHTVYECFVGEDEIADLRYKQAMKDAVRAVRSTSSASVSKPMIQAIVIAVVSALSRAADDADGDNGLDDSGADLPDWANRVLVWFLGLWVRDDTGVSVIDMLVQPHALILACVTMLMLVLCIRTLCCRASDRGQVNVQIAGPRDHVSFQFDRQLNLHVGVGAPGTPTNPLSFDFDGDDSPPHVLSALRKGARSKASTRPGPRYDDEDAPHPDASSSAAPPTGAMNAVQAHVPPADHASAPGTPAESMSSQLSTQSFRELHGYPIAVARRMNHRGSLVWVSHTGHCYHRLRCFKLDGCDRVKAYERHEAQNRGLRACKKCNP
ncbi:RE1 [Symbiodinium sp. CCMP2592]|nr:RE1 [Symbiodinium sp. CCMP2592]